MIQPQEIILGGLLGLAVSVLLILALSPFLNWMGGNGFTWYF